MAPEADIDERDLWRPGPLAVQPKAKGRPRKYPAHVCTKKDRAAWTASQTQCAGAAAAVVQRVDRLSNVLRPVGGPMPELVAKIVAQFASGIDVAPRVCDVVDSYLGFLPGDTWIGSISVNRAALQLALPPRVLGRQLRTTASSIFAGSRALAGSILSTMYRLQLQKKILIEGVFTNVLYDETPLSIRINTRGEPDAAGVSQKEPDALPTTTKLLCLEFEISVLARDVASGKYTLTIIVLPCPVIGMQRGTGQILKSCIQAATAVPYLKVIRSTPTTTDGEVLGELPVSVDVSCADRANSNNTAEDGLYAETVVDGMRLRFPCVAHIGATSIGRGLQTCGKDVSGTIAMCLAMDGAGRTKDLRHCIIAVLVESAEVINAAPHHDGHESVQYLRELLVLCLPCSKAGQDRARLLLSLLTSDVREPYLQLRVPGGAASHFV